MMNINRGNKSKITYNTATFQPFLDVIFSEQAVLHENKCFSLSAADQY
jgi:hypothetical protein